MFHNIPVFQDFQWGAIYFVSSRVNGGAKAFLQDEDYSIFLKYVKQFLLPISDIYAYSLCSNTFDFLLCIKSKNQIFNLLNLDEKEIYDTEQQHLILFHYFEKLVENYTLYHHQKYKNNVPLFGKFIKRIQINQEEELKNIMKQIHLQPQDKQEITEFSAWKFSSYQTYLSKGKTSAVDRDFLLQFFSSEEDFINFHH